MEAPNLMHVQSSVKWSNLGQFQAQARKIEKIKKLFTCQNSYI